VHSDSADGDVTNERASEEPRGVRRSAVQPREVIHKHTGTPQDLARIYGSLSFHPRKLF